MEDLSASLDALYLQVSTSFVSGLKSAFSANLVMFVLIGYGILALFVLLASFFEVMFFRKRDQKIYRTLTNVFWCLFGPGAVLFSVFLAILAPLTAAGTEYYAMLEPALLNRTFYGKLEYPNDKIKAGLFPCTHGDGKFHTSGLPFGNPLIQFSDMADFLNVTMNMDSNLNALTAKFTDVTTKMNSFEKFQEDLYIPPSTSNQNRKISIMLKVLNAYTNKDTPYTFNNIAISQDPNCGAGVWTYDVWVADQASCPAGYTPFDGVSPAAPAKTCLCRFSSHVGFSGKTWATDSTVINRYPNSCSDMFSPPNVYRTAAGSYLSLIKNHHTDVVKN